jgi:hypothetical protein
MLGSVVGGWPAMADRIISGVMSMTRRRIAKDFPSGDQLTDCTSGPHTTSGGKRAIADFSVSRNCRVESDWA